MSDILTQIIATKRTEIAARQQSISLDEIRQRAEARSDYRAFSAALAARAAAHQPGVIAEIKKASPSKGVIRADFDPVQIAHSYARAGATCLSVLTDEQYFQGSDQYLIDVRASVELPVLRKDFVVDDYQIYEAAAMGADAILLIVAALDVMQLTVLHQTARSIGIDVLIEVHNKVELDAALTLNPTLIGINNRDLKTFTTSLDTTSNLLEHIPPGVTVVTESGIRTPEDVAQMRSAGVSCFLVGEAFMRVAEPGSELTRLFHDIDHN